MSNFKTLSPLPTPMFAMYFASTLPCPDKGPLWSRMKRRQARKQRVGKRAIVPHPPEFFETMFSCEIQQQVTIIFPKISKADSPEFDSRSGHIEDLLAICLASCWALMGGCKGLVLLRKQPRGPRYKQAEMGAADHSSHSESSTIAGDKRNCAAKTLSSHLTEQICSGVWRQSRCRSVNF